MVKIGIPLKYHHLDDGRCILYLGERTRRTIQLAGGFVIPIVQVQDVDYYDTKFNEYKELSELEKKSIDNYLDMVDGVLFPGGHKITPFDVYLLRRCIERDIPTLGICLGMQLMSCYNEYFEVYRNESDINHYQDSDFGFAHKVLIKKDSTLYKILGKEELMVNSFHNYHVSIDNQYIVTANSEDGYIEGIELPNKKFHMGIQWHPEISYEFDEDSKKIINYFIEVCKK
ncbi:MAG: gamma-glutamyl-gamma-aminobutyrate hydrolase family protein [Bacilli bacterium]|nr:gamma-glutamyl-gamma-aminobutyrate hydrolase family protein [Bacilli bacterium]